MLAPALRGHVHYRAFEQFQQTLLHALAAHVARDGGVVTLAGNFVDFVNEDDAALGLGNIVVTGCQQPCQQALDVLAHIACLG